jgi:hypothetical protein
LAAVNFCTNETEINLKENSLTLSRLFLWYKSDFVTLGEQDDKCENPDEALIG